VFDARLMRLIKSVIHSFIQVSGGPDR